MDIDTTGWPEHYIDDHGGAHEWTDIAPPDPDSYDDGTPILTYARLLVEMAAARDMTPLQYLGLDDY
jgi:hypothetical protein